MTVKLFKMNTGDDMIGTEIEQQNKHSMTIKLNYPMYILTDVSESGNPLVALKLVNFYGAEQIVEIDREQILFTSSPRKALEQFYTHTVENYFTYYDARIDNMLQTTLDEYLEDHEEQTSELLDLFSKIVPTSNTSFQ